MTTQKKEYIEPEILGKNFKKKEQTGKCCENPFAKNQMNTLIKARGISSILLPLLFLILTVVLFIKFIFWLLPTFLAWTVMALIAWMFLSFLLKVKSFFR